jgi:hypothetical protein
VSYRTGEGAKALFPNADLSLCSVPCEVEKMESKISLATGHIGKGCDRDTYSVENQRRICGKLNHVTHKTDMHADFLTLIHIFDETGADVEASDLLPPPKSGKEWTVTLPTDDGTEGDQVSVTRSKIKTTDVDGNLVIII